MRSIQWCIERYDNFLLVSINILLYIYRVSQNKRNGCVLRLCSIQTVILLTSLDRASSLLENNTKNIKIICLITILFYEYSLMRCHIWALSLLCHWWVDPQITDQSDLLWFCSVQQVIFLPILFRECFIHYSNDTKINKYGWKLFMLWAFSCGRIFFCNLQIERFSCLKTLEIRQMPKMTVHKKLLIK